MDLRARHVARAMGQERREVARARPHLVDGLARLHRELLQDARLDLRLHHRLAVAERDLEVGEGELPVFRRHEILALHLEQQVEDRGIEHLPGADLLLDHVEARLLEIHGGKGSREGGRNHPEL